MKNEEFWQTPRGMAVKKLIGWAVFFAIVFLLLILERPVRTYNDKEEQVKEQFKLYPDMLEELAQDNYAYTFNIKINDNNYLLEGQKDGTQDLGIFEENEKMFKYYRNNDGLYKINLKKLEPIETLNENIDQDIVNIKTFLESIKTIDYQIEKEEDTRNVIYHTDNSLVITTDLEHITTISYTKGIDEYIFEFKDIGKIDKIVLDN